MMKYAFSIAVMIALAAGAAFGQFYEYKDKNGNTVITDSPPPGVQGREKHFEEERIFRSTRSEKDYPAFDDKEAGGRASRREEQPKKNYNRVFVVMYMTDW